jgi:hypothetical protein
MSGPFLIWVKLTAFIDEFLIGRQRRSPGDAAMLQYQGDGGGWAGTAG